MAAPLSLRENTPEDRRIRYEQALRRIMDEADKLDAAALTRIQQLVIEMQQRVTERLSAQLVTGRAESNWGAFWIPRLIRAIDDVVNGFSERAGRLLQTEFFPEAWRLGGQLVDNTVQAVSGLALDTPLISQVQLAVLAPYSAQLITGISEQTRQSVDKAIRVNVALGESPQRLMDQIAADIPTTKGTPFRTVADRAEAITRTEVARVQELANNARLEQTLMEFPELREQGLKQVFTSVQIGPWPCKICEPLDGTVWDIDDREKPQPPMHPRCRCMLSPYFEGISKIRTVPEPESKRQRRASLAECGCCG